MIPEGESWCGHCGMDTPYDGWDIGEDRQEIYRTIYDLSP